MAKGGSRVCARRRSNLLSRKKVTKERPPYCPCPFAALRATCDARAGRGLAQLAPAVLKQTRALIRPPLRFSARPQGLRHPYGPLLRSAWGKASSSHSGASFFPRPSAAKARVVPSPCGCACGGVLAGWHARWCAHASLAGPADTVQGVAKVTRARPSRRATQRVRPHAQGTQRRGAGSGELPFGLPRKGAVCDVARACKAPALLRTCALHTAPLRGNAIPLHSVSRPSLAVVVRA